MPEDIVVRSNITLVKDLIVDTRMTEIIRKADQIKIGNGIMTGITNARMVKK
jgi:hypothetical protein